VRKLAIAHLASFGIVLLVASPVTGQVVIDGDSLQVGGRKYYLNGIDAPEIDQICPDGWPAGFEARRYLDKLVDDKEVACTALVGRRNEEVVALCRVDGVDLGSAMVTAGQAFAFVPYSARYIAQEAAAVRANRGVHAHHCAPPWEWRARLGR
jgi:endonuclease YncB( thermonuclease family)